MITQDGSCTDQANFQIEGSGLSIVGMCVPPTLDAPNVGGTWDVYTAGTIGSCPNNFNSTFILKSGSVVLESTDGTTAGAVGLINWYVCGSNVCGTGSFTGSYIGDISAVVPEIDRLTGTIQITGTCNSNCGTRNITIDNININSN
jgi:hypothetical protein